MHIENQFPIVCLGNYIDVVHGYAFDGDGITDSENDPVLVTPGNFEIGGGFKSDNKKHYHGDYPPEYLLKPGDLIVTMTDLSVSGDTLGYSALVPDDGNIYLHNQRIGKIVLKSEKMDKVFLYFLLRTKEYQHYIVSTSTGTAIHHTSPSSIKTFKFKLLPIDQQRKIASILYSLERLSIEIAKINDNLGGVCFAS